MKKLVFFLICECLFTQNVLAQDAELYYKQGNEKAQNGDYTGAIELFTQTIGLQPENAYAWYNRGIAKSLLNDYAEAQKDFEQCVTLAPDYKKGWLNLGTAKKRQTDYNGAIAEYTHALTLDPQYSDAFYNRGLVYEMLNKRDLACADFTKALEYGDQHAKSKTEKCNDPEEMKKMRPSILTLRTKAKDKQYGFTPEKPIMVGSGPDGGPANQRAYLNLLRDRQGKPVQYKRLGNCCEYKSENGFLGMALLDRYEIIYLDDQGQQQKVIVYMSFYDYEEPLLLWGFKTVGER